MSKSEEQALKVWIGRHVSLELKYQDGEVEQLELDLVEDNAADFERGFLGESTPLAKAIIGQVAGSHVTYSAGDSVEVRILTVSAKLKGEPVDLSDRREETIQKALRQSERASATIYASSVNNKWGDYDPDSLPKD